MPRIVTLNVTQTSAAIPPTLQQTGAAISQGATTLAQGADSLLTQAADLTPLLVAPLALTAIVWTAGTVVATAAAAIPGLTTGDQFITEVGGNTPAGYNGLVLATVTGANTFTYPLAVNPGVETAPGTYTPPNQQELIAMVDEYFSQGTSQAVYVLELGAGDGASGPLALSTWIQNNPGVFYAYLVPRLWDGTTNYIALCKQYSNNTSLTYFFTTTTVANYALYNGIKSVVWFIEAPGANAAFDSFDCASLFQMWLYGTVNGPPSSASLMGPFGWRFSFGTTAWPQKGNAPTIATLDAAKVNYITTGAPGGINSNCIANGYTADGKPMQYWWAGDWLQVNLPLNLANAVINAANNGSPIDYDQDGVDTLQGVAKSTFQTASAYNLINGTILGTDLTGVQFSTNFNSGDYDGQNVINAVPFTTYAAQNPSAYANQQYGGFSAVATPMLGIQSIIFDLDLTDFV
jgi:hypothetical protein